MNNPPASPSPSITAPPKVCLVALAVAVAACSGEPIAPVSPGATGPSAAASTALLPAPTPPPFRMPEGVAPVKIAATLTLVPSEDTFRGTAELSLSVLRPTQLIWLHATALDVSEAHLDLPGGQRRAARIVPGDKRFVGFAFDAEVPAGPARLSVNYTGHVLGSDAQGVFRTQAGGDVYLASQFEEVDARRAFPCFDEPSFKIPWQLTLRVRPSDTAISNTPGVEDKVDGEGFKTVRFAETKPLPSYLVAFAVGPFEQVDAGKAGKRATPIRLFVPRGRSSEAQYAAASAPKILPLLEEATGLPYPFEKLDYVVVPGSSTMSSMENAGMILMPTAYTLAKPAELTVTQRRSIVQIIAHETAHHWFGDLATMAWWDDLWLNEGFATWISPKITDQIDPAFDIAVRGTDRLDRAMDLDGLLSARKIRQEINGYDDISNAFDLVTYTKGAAVLSMFEAWLGAAEFRRGVRLYLERFTWKNATSSDFLSAMNESTGKDVKAAFSSFLDQPGVSIVASSLVCDGAGARLALSQERYLPTGSRGSASGSVWQIPVCARYGSGKASGRACTLLTAGTGELALPRLEGGKSCPAWATIKEAGKGYYRASYPARETGVLLDPRQAPLTAIERVMLVKDMRALVANGRLPIGDALGRLAALMDDPSPAVQAAAAGMLVWISRDRLPEALWPSARRFVGKVIAPRARALGWQAKADEGPATLGLRRDLLDAIIEHSDDPRLFAEARSLADGWLDGKETLDPDSVEQILRAAASHGDKKLFDRFVAALKVEKDPRRNEPIVSALASFREPSLLEAGLALTLDPSFDPRVTTALLTVPRHDGLPLTWDFFEKHFDEVVNRVPLEDRAETLRMIGGFCDDARRAEIAAFLEKRAATITGGPRIAAQGLEKVALCAATRAAQADGLRAFLEKQ